MEFHMHVRRSTSSILVVFLLIFRSLIKIDYLRSLIEWLTVNIFNDDTQEVDWIRNHSKVETDNVNYDVTWASIDDYTILSRRKENDLRLQNFT